MSKYLFKKEKSSKIRTFYRQQFSYGAYFHRNSSITPASNRGGQIVTRFRSQFNYTDGRQKSGLLSPISRTSSPLLFPLRNEKFPLPRQLYDGFSKIPARDFTIYPGIAR